MRRLVKFLRVSLVAFISALLLGCGSEVALVAGSLESDLGKEIEKRFRVIGKDLYGKIQVKKAKEGRYDIFIPIKDKVYTKAYLDDFRKRSKRLKEVRDGDAKDIIIGGFVYGFACTQLFLPPSGIMAGRILKNWGPRERSPYIEPGPGYKWLPPIMATEKINSIEVEVWICKGKSALDMPKRDEYGNIIPEEQEPPFKIGSLKLSCDAKPEGLKWENWSYASKEVKEQVWQKAIVKVE